MADVGIAVGVREVLRFVPDNGGIHAGEDSRAVATGEGCVEALDEINVRLGHGKGLRYPEAVYRNTIPVDQLPPDERCSAVDRRVAEMWLHSAPGRLCVDDGAFGPLWAGDPPLAWAAAALLDTTS
jgi:hypothetical protein